MKYFIPYCLMSTALIISPILGCTSTSSESMNSPDAIESHDDHDHSGHESHSDNAQNNMDKMKTELAKLSPEDAASAEKQHMCPVTNEMLGTMGPPKKIDVIGQQVWICCDGCKDKILTSPEKYLAKMNKE